MGHPVVGKPCHDPIKCHVNRGFRKKNGVIARFTGGYPPILCFSAKKKGAINPFFKHSKWYKVNLPSSIGTSLTSSAKKGLQSRAKFLIHN